VSAPSQGRTAKTTPAGREARRQAALILEALGGLRSATEAAEAMGIAPARYYVLERRAIRGLIEALEPRPPGRQRSLEAELEHFRREKERLERELLRYQALHRASQRAIGVPREDGAAPARRRKKKATRVRRRKSRVEKVLPKLQAEESAKSAPSVPVGSDNPSDTGEEV